MVLGCEMKYFFISFFVNHPSRAGEISFSSVDYPTRSEAVGNLGFDNVDPNEIVFFNIQRVTRKQYLRWREGE